MSWIIMAITELMHASAPRHLAAESSLMTAQPSWPSVMDNSHWWTWRFSSMLLNYVNFWHLIKNSAFWSKKKYNIYHLPSISVSGIPEINPGKFCCIGLLNRKGPGLHFAIAWVCLSFRTETCTCLSLIIWHPVWREVTEDLYAVSHFQYRCASL